MTALAAEGRRAGRFELKRLLGRGAQASVWLAHDPRLQRDVALKLLGSGADAADIDTWMHQARAVSRLQHPNIVPVFEANNLDGEPCLVFEHVEGGTLADAILRDGAMAPRRAVECRRIMCSTLSSKPHQRATALAMASRSTPSTAIAAASSLMPGSSPCPCSLDADCIRRPICRASSGK